MFKTLVAGASLALAGGAQAATTIDFTGQAAGPRANGFTISGVSFFDTDGEDLQINDFVESVGTGLAVFPDDPSGLRMTFAALSTNLSLVFGNDDPFFTIAGDQALLRVFRGGVQVGASAVALNGNDLADQTIGVWGVSFDSATFIFADEAGAPLELVEVVDNISFDVVAGAVPEPAAWGLMILGVGAVGGALRRRARVALRPATA